jgi:hypothetical protein
MLMGSCKVSAGGEQLRDGSWPVLRLLCNQLTDINVSVKTADNTHPDHPQVVFHQLAPTCQEAKGKGHAMG